MRRLLFLTATLLLTFPFLVGWSGEGGSSFTGTMTENLTLGNYYISYDGTDAGISMDSSNRVGIGTASPDNPLTLQLGTNDGTDYFDIQDSDGTDVFTVDSNGGTKIIKGAGSGISAYSYYDELVIESDYHTGISILTEALSHDPGIAFGRGDNGGDNRHSVIVHDMGEEALHIKTVDADGQIVFKTATDTEAMRIDKSQRVGIGTNSPTSKLDVRGNVNGYKKPVVITTCEGAHDGANDAATLSDSGESLTADAYIGMTIYNETDGSSCTVTDNDGTTITCTLSGGTEDDWDTGDVWAVGPGPGQSGSVFYVNASTTIRHPATVGYEVHYYDLGGSLVIDPVSASMQIFNEGSGIGAGDELDSPGGAGDYVELHNASATQSYTLSIHGTWVDGGSS